LTVPVFFPNSEWIGSMRQGKEWRGETAPILVIHTLEGNYWPDPQRWESPSHIVCNPNTGEIKQYVSMNKAAYSVRDNALEDDYPTWQVELWGKAANVPGYSDEWYQGVANLLDTFHDVYNIPVVFADFSNVSYGADAPQRMTDEAIRAFSGFLGHCHMGKGVDTHWDPGELDVEKVKGFMKERDSVWANDITDKTWMTMFHNGVPGVSGFGRYYCSNDGTYVWPSNAPWGSDPHPTAPDGQANYDEKVNALNYLLQGFAIAAGTG